LQAIVFGKNLDNYLVHSFITMICSDAIHVYIIIFTFIAYLWGVV